MYGKILFVLLLGVSSTMYSASVGHCELMRSHPLLDQVIFSSNSDKTELVEKLLPEGYRLFTIGKMQDGQHLIVCRLKEGHDASRLQQPVEKTDVVDCRSSRKSEFAVFKGELEKLQKLKIFRSRKKAENLNKFFSDFSPARMFTHEFIIRKGIENAQEGELRMLVTLGVEEPGWIYNTKKFLSILRVHNKGTVGTYSSRAYNAKTLEKQCLQFPANGWFEGLQSKDAESSDCDAEIPQEDWVEWYL